MSFGISAAGVASLIGSAATVYSASKSGKSQTSTTQNQLNPGMQELLYGDGTNGGLLSYNLGLLSQPRTQGLNTFGQYADAYMGADAPYDQGQIRNTATALATSNGMAPQIQAARGNYTTPLGFAQSAFPGNGQGQQNASANVANVSLINSPSQNGINLNPALGNFAYGDLGNNPYLTGSIQKGLNQSSNQFNQLQDSLTKNFKENILGSIRGEALANGGYGGSRQGIAEAKAADSLATQLGNALSQVGQNNTDAAVQAQANAYNQDRQNQLNAVMGLSGQQYNVAGQNAGFQNQNALSNAGMLNQNSQFNAGVGNNYLAQMLQNNQFNANAQNQMYGQQYSGNQAMNLQNLANQQGTNQFNAGNVMNMAQLNSQNKATGAGLLGGLVAQNNQYANNLNDYDVNRATKVNNLINPYTGLGGSVQTSSPIYQNQGANALGGAMAGLQLYKQFGSNSGGNPYTSQNQYSGGNDGWTLPNGESLGT